MKLLKTIGLIVPFCISILYTTLTSFGQTTFNNTGNVQTYTVPTSGCYTLQVWGAKGGNDAGHVGGNGGYCQGKVILEAGDILYIYVGGQGQSGAIGTGGGYNGGGNSGNIGNSGAGGGATDIRRNGQALSNRIIVAGGGGGAGNDSGANGGHAGGLIGLTGSGSAGGVGGSQTAGGTGGSAGTLGVGGNRASGNDGGGGGGGYYGGGASTSGDNGGGGGSSFLGNTYNIVYAAGNQSMPNSQGSGTTIGNAASGKAIITFNSAYSVSNCPSNMTICNSSATWTRPSFSSCPLGDSISGMKYLGTNNGNYYYYVPRQMSWTDARTNAELRGGRLAVIESAAENTLIRNGLNTLGVASAWIGFSDAATEGQFVSITGVPLSSDNGAALVSNNVYHNWAAGEPNDWGTGEDYVCINVSTGTWNDTENNDLRGYVIEYGVFQTSGLASGATNFPVGVTTITYSLYVPLSSKVLCSFSVNRLMPQGNPNVFGNYSWNVYGYSDNSTYNSSASLANTYYGYYTQTPNNTSNFGFNSVWSWNNQASSPSSAVAYSNSDGNGTIWQGCILPNDQFTFVHKRRGFDCGTYNLSMQNWDDATRVIVNGNVIWNCPGTSTAGTCVGQSGANSAANLGNFELNSSSTIEVWVAENTGNSRVQLNISKVISGQLAANGQQKTCPVVGNQWVDFYSYPDGNYIASVRGTSTTSDLGLVTATAYVDGSVQLVPACTNAAYQTAVMQRHWVINPTINGSAVVLLPYTNVELSNLYNASVTSSSPDDLLVGGLQQNVHLSKYSGPANVNASALDNCPPSGSGNTTIYTQFGSGANPVTGVSALYSTFSIPGFSEFWLHGSTYLTPLATELVQFDAICNGGTTSIHVKVDPSQDANYYFIQQSRDGVHWNDLVRSDVDHNFSSNLTIEFEHVATTSMYYRLMRSSFDGFETQIRIISSDCMSDEFGILVYPNPVLDVITIQVLSSETFEDSEVQLFDVTGKLVRTRQISIEKGTQTITLDCSDLAEGSYTVAISKSNAQLFKPVRLHKL